MNTFTCTVLIYVVLTVGLILTMLTKKVIFLDIGCVLAVICAILFIWSSVSTGVSLIKKQVSKPKPTEIAIPSKYINQTYFVEHKQLYVQYNDTIKKFGGNISSKIEYSASAKEPANSL